MDAKRAQMYIYSASLVLFACSLLAAAQQPQPTPVAPICGNVTTKPAPTTSTYTFQTCIVAKFAGYLSIGQGKYVELKNGAVNTNSSQCQSAANPSVNPRLVIDFGKCAQLELEISKQTNGMGVYVKAINGFYKVANETTQFSNSTALFQTTQTGHYYKCNTEQPIVLNKPGQTLVLSNFAYEAFRDVPGTDFYQIPEECALDSSQVSDLVRIGVGICLVALVVIVLVAYFVGRRRWSERSSYESV